MEKRLMMVMVSTEKIDLAPLDALFFGPLGSFKLLPAKELRDVPPLHLSWWCNQRGRYVVPTVELIEWLDALIGDRTVLEICAGMGDLGKQLAWRMSDSYIQTESPEIALMLAATGTVPTKPSPLVEKLEAVEAVKKYKPKVVVGAYVTQLYKPGDEREPKVGSSIYGVDERKIWDRVETYIHIGNWNVHGDKRLLKRPHKVYENLPFLFTRAIHPEKNVVFVWDRRAL